MDDTSLAATAIDAPTAVPGALTDDQVRARIDAGTPAALYEGKRVLVLTPDATRTAPMPQLVRAVHDTIGERAAQLDFMVALGTHSVMSDDQLDALYGLSPELRAGEYADHRFLNHRWDQPDSLKKIGTIRAEEVASLSEGRFSEAVDVTINRAIFEYDLLLIVGPVFPHEIVGFSGGHKYLFPGISGGEFLDFFHWMSAVITCRKTIGREDTPARRVIEKAASMVEVPCHLVALVVSSASGMTQMEVGPPTEAWPAAVAASRAMHIVHTPRAYDLVLGHAPEMYDEMWVAGKVMYKLEPIVADGGKLIIYGPHITEISRTWGKHLQQTGYHVASYFDAQAARFAEVPRGVLAHSALVKGEGSYAGGVERPRIEVVLATGIDRTTCERINLGYLDHREVDIDSYRGREDEGVRYVPHAGETLHRVSGSPAERLHRER